MESSGNLISAAAEFSSGVKHREDYRRRRDSLLRVNTHGNSAPVIGNSYDVLGQKLNVYAVAVARESFVYRVGDYLIYEMMQPFRTRRTDIHTRALANGLEPFKNLNFSFST